MLSFNGFYFNPNKICSVRAYADCVEVRLTDKFIRVSRGGCPELEVIDFFFHKIASVGLTCLLVNSPGTYYLAVEERVNHVNITKGLVFFNSADCDALNTKRQIACIKSWEEDF